MEICLNEIHICVRSLATNSLHVMNEIYCFETTATATSAISGQNVINVIQNCIRRQRPQRFFLHDAFQLQISHLIVAPFMSDI
jgi:hypothetical protein